MTLPPLDLHLATTVTSGVNQNGANWSLGQGDWNVNVAATNSSGFVAAPSAKAAFPWVIAAVAVAAYYLYK